MPSSFGWLDYSDAERRRVLDVVQSLREKDTRDELGLATVRDGLADLLAPGLSTIQTRPRYFLFIPWLYLQIEERLRRSPLTDKAAIAQEARRAEIGLIDALVGNGEREGVIGVDARKALQRLPSSVYWSGLESWGIRRFPGPVDAYQHRLAVYGPPPRRGDADPGEGLANWHPGLPKPPADFPGSAVMALQPGEADYLRDRIVQMHPGTLLGQLVLADDVALDVEYPWEAVALGVELPSPIAATVTQARNFAETLHGAALIYNLMLAERRDFDPWIERYRGRLADWAELVEARRGELAGWSADSLWQLLDSAQARIPGSTRRFVTEWLDRLFAVGHAGDLADEPAIREMIRRRERRLKKSLSRLDNPRRLETWGGASGSQRMSYRWDTLRTVLRDLSDATAGPTLDA